MCNDSSLRATRVLPRQYANTIIALAIFTELKSSSPPSGLPPPPLPTDPFNDLGGGRGCNKFVPVLGGDGTKIVPTGDIFDQPPGGMSFIRGKPADHVGDYLVLPPEGAVLVTSPGTESSYPRPPQKSLNNSTFSVDFPLFTQRSQV